MANYSVPTVPTMARNGATTLEALSNALMFYMKLKDQEKNDAYKQSELARQNKTADIQGRYYDAQTDNMKADNTRLDQEAAFKHFNTTADNYAGSRVPKTSPIVDQATKAGIDPSLAFTPEMTLPAARIPGAMGLPEGGTSNPGVPQPGQAPIMPAPMPGAGPNYFKPAPVEDTGNLILNTPEPAKVRMQQAALAAKATNTDKVIEGQNTRAAITSQDKANALEQSKWYQEAKLVLQKMGLGQAAERLKLAVANGDRAQTALDWHMADQQYDNQFHADPLAFMKAFGVEMPNASPAPAIAPPVPPTPGARPTAPAHKSRFTVIEVN